MRTRKLAGSPQDSPLPDHILIIARCQNTTVHLSPCNPHAMFDLVCEQEHDDWGNYGGSTRVMETFTTHAKAKAAAKTWFTDQWDDSCFVSYWTHDKKLGDDGDVGSLKAEEPVPFFVKAIFQEGEIMRLWVEERDTNGKSVIPDESWSAKPWAARQAARATRDALKVKKTGEAKKTSTAGVSKEKEKGLYVIT